LGVEDLVVGVGVAWRGGDRARYRWAVEGDGR
jgi:hypothetical protein